MPTEIHTRMTPTQFPCWKCGAMLNRLDPTVHGWSYHCPACQMLTSPRHEMEKAQADLPRGAIGIVTGTPCVIRPVRDVKNYGTEKAPGPGSFAEKVQALDMALTGKRPQDVAHSWRNQEPNFGNPEFWAFGGSRAIYCLSDGGYSRVCWSDVSGRLFLTGGSRQEVLDRWGQCREQIRAVEDEIKKAAADEQTPADSVEHEVYQAYIDCQPAGQCQGRRLTFRASRPVGRDRAIAILKKCIPNGYNNFDADLLEHLPPDTQITIARESSVCLYVKGEVDANTGCGVMMADELNYLPAGDETRLWWD